MPASSASSTRAAWRRSAFVPDDVPGDETLPLEGRRGDRRLQAQQGRGASGWSRRWSPSDALPAVIVNPSTPIGPRDVRPTPTGRIIVEAATGRMPGFVDTGLNLVACRRRRCRASRGAPTAGASESATFWAARTSASPTCCGEIAGLVGRTPPRWRRPASSSRRSPMPPRALARVTGREPFLTLDGLRMSKHRMFFSSAKATREFGYVARPYAKASSTPSRGSSGPDTSSDDRRHRGAGVRRVGVAAAVSRRILARVRAR